MRMTQDRILILVEACEHLTKRLDLFRAQARGAASIIGTELDSHEECRRALIDLAQLANSVMPEELAAIRAVAYERAYLTTARVKSNLRAREAMRATRGSRRAQIENDREEIAFRDGAAGDDSNGGAFAMSAQTQYEHDNLLQFNALSGWEDLGRLINNHFKDQGAGRGERGERGAILCEIPESQLASYLISICDNEKDDPDDLAHRAETQINELIDRGLLEFTVTQGE